MNPNIWFILLFTLFGIRTVRNVLYQVFLWQLKEYRLDRMLSHIKTSQGKKLLFGKLSLVKWFLLVIAIIFNFGGFFIIFVLSVYTVEVIINLKEFVTNLKKPKFTQKATLLIILSLLFALLGFALFPSGVGLLIVDKLLPFFIAIEVALISLPSRVAKYIFFKKANSYFNKTFRGKVIGITGSVGKTTTKEFISSILSTQFSVVKTLGSQNVDTSIAQTVLKNISGKEDFFIAEMAAYKGGEIKKICDIVRPEIGIITEIGLQHVDLFGSQANIMKAKFELIEALPKGGLAFFNGNNTNCLLLAEKSRHLGINTFVFGIGKNPKFDYIADDIEISPAFLQFTLSVQGKNIHIKANLLGYQNIPNILGAIAIAHKIGMSLDKIAQAVKSLFSPDKTMKFIGHWNSANLIDDTFNASPEALTAALEYMSVYRGKKVLVLTPMIELGKFGESIHEEIGEKCAMICDEILLTNLNYYSSFVKGATKVKNGTEKIQVINTKTAALVLEKYAGKNSVILFEGKEAGKIITEII